MLVNTSQLPIMLSQLLLDSLKPQKVSQATKTLLQLRQTKNYFYSLLQVLTKTTSEDQFSLPLIIQFKNYLKQNPIGEDQLLKIKENLIFLLTAHGCEKSDKILGQIVSILTYKYFDCWIDIEQINRIILKPVPSNNFIGYGWVISALVGIPRSCTYYYCSEEGSKPKLCLFDKLLEGMTEKIVECEMIELYFVFCYLQEYAYMSNPRDLNSFFTKHFSRIIGCGLNLWDIREQDFPEKTHLYLALAKQQYAKLLDEIMCKQQMYKKNDNQIYDLAPWKTQKFEDLLLKFILGLKGQETQKQLRVLKVLNYFIRILKPKNLYPLVQKLLYVTIPQLLFEFRNVVLFDSLEIRGKQMNFIPVRIKENLVNLWGNLSCLNLNDNFDLSQRNQKIGKLRKGDRKIGTSLSTYSLHMKFLFQKLSEVHFFFSPFQIQKNLYSKQVWQGEEWIIVAFDIFKQVKSKLQLPQNFEISQSIPQILISYVLPKLFHRNHIIRKHVISVITTYSRSFADLKLTEEFKSNFLKLLQENQDQESAVYIFLVLPDLIWNLSLYSLVEKRVNSILLRFTKFLKQKQDHQLAKSFSHFIKIFENQIENSQPILIDFISHFFSVCNDPKTNTLIYTDCIHSLFMITMEQDKILKELFELVKFTLKQPEQSSGIQIVQYDVLQIISTYIAKKESLTNQDMVIFQIYCYYLSSGKFAYPPINLQIIGNSIDLSWIKQINHCYIPEDSLLNMIWVLHSFSLKPEMFWYSKVTKNKPICTYIKTLKLCIDDYNNKIPEKDEQFLQIFHVTLYGIIFVLDDLSMQEVESGLNEILTDIWILVVESIYKMHRKAIFKVIFDKNKMEKPEMVDDWNEYRSRSDVIQIKKRLVEVLSTFIYLFPGQSATFFSQSDSLIQQYLCMVSFYSLSDKQDKDYIKRALLGISYLIHGFQLQKTIAKQCLKLLNQFINQTIERTSQSKEILKMNNQNIYDDDDSCFFDDQLPITIQFNIPKFKQEYILQEIDQISQSLQTIRDYLEKDTKKDKQELKLINSILEKGSLFLAQLGISL